MYGIYLPHIHHTKIILHLFTWDHGRPVSSLLYDSTGKNTLLSQLNKTFQYTETIIKNYIPTSDKIAFHHTQKLTHSLTADVFKLEWTRLAGMGLKFYQLKNKQDYRQCTAISVPIIPIWMGLPRTEYPSRSCPSAMPDGHGLVKEYLPRGKEYGSHVVIPCL